MDERKSKRLATMQSGDCTIRSATLADVHLLARLLDIAGEGIPSYLWGLQCAPGQDPFAIGAQRAARREGCFSYTNAVIAERDGRAAGMLLGYPQPDPYETGSLAELPPVVRPLVELEALSPGSWYLNAIAALPDQRGTGVGSTLMAVAGDLARRSACRSVSLIVAEENRRALALYRRLGYLEVARRPVVGFPGCRHGGDWLLMVQHICG